MGSVGQASEKVALDDLFALARKQWSPEIFCLSRRRE